MLSESSCKVYLENIISEIIPNKFFCYQSNNSKQYLLTAIKEVTVNHNVTVNGEVIAYITNNNNQ